MSRKEWDGQDVSPPPDMKLSSWSWVTLPRFPPPLPLFCLGWVYVCWGRTTLIWRLIMAISSFTRSKSWSLNSTLFFLLQQINTVRYWYLLETTYVTSISLLSCLIRSSLFSRSSLRKSIWRYICPLSSSHLRIFVAYYWILKFNLSVLSLFSATISCMRRRS